MRRLRNYWVYSAGLLVAWVVVLALSVTVKGAIRAEPVFYAFLGFALGWVSTTMARYVYPPPAKWTRPRNHDA